MTCPLQREGSYCLPNCALFIHDCDKCALVLIAESLRKAVSSPVTGSEQVSGVLTYPGKDSNN